MASSEEERRIIGFLFKEARELKERSDEGEGLGAYLNAGKRVQLESGGARLLSNELGQTRSHNSRLGVHALGTPEGQLDKQSRDKFALDLEYTKRSTEVRLKGQKSGTASKRKQRQSDLLPDGKVRKIDDVFGTGQDSSDDFSDKDSVTAKVGADKKVDPWPTKGLRVRIIDEVGELKKYHLNKGIVRSVDNAGLFCIMLEKSKELVRKVPEKCLETVVSKDCSRIEVVRGEHRGMQAQLLKRDPKNNIAIIRMSKGFGEGYDIPVALDDVCEFA